MPLSLHSSQIGTGWRELQADEPLTTLTQSLLPDKGIWVDATYMTKDGAINRGRMNYRVPTTFGAKVRATFTALPKLWRRWVLRSKW